jgi:hypothetical protein
VVRRVAVAHAAAGVAAFVSGIRGGAVGADA